MFRLLPGSKVLLNRSGCLRAARVDGSVSLQLHGFHSVYEAMVVVAWLKSLSSANDRLRPWSSSDIAGIRLLATGDMAVWIRSSRLSIARVRCMRPDNSVLALCDESRRIRVGIVNALGVPWIIAIVEAADGVLLLIAPRRRHKNLSRV